ncbi:conjugal transfer protein [Enterococcus faecalis]|uniref:helix-turn-helix domain-containing protein n=1 Tax=Enterococcus faecalis TaxID=1351 RepID=UPI000A19EC32|nr:helix-turn-helix domain-containing protein [Enterococcus faecalis]OSM25652.1 conjugal transfer protein [Enterococcus faecalis]OSM28851.1 conjugal transfer protein [Enterococcus faecalis]WPH47992.1 helix-turn-helix domain-containing protein [Enterococcus faecalis]
MKTTYSRVPFDVIVQAIDGDVVAINQIREHFRPYLMRHSLRFMMDEVGKNHVVVDEVLFARFETRLIKKILTFKIQ